MGIHGRGTNEEILSRGPRVPGTGTLNASTYCHLLTKGPCTEPGGGDLILIPCSGEWWHVQVTWQMARACCDFEDCLEGP